MRGEGLKLSEEILSSCHFIHHKSHVDWPEDPCFRVDSPASNRWTMTRPLDVLLSALS